MSIWLAVALVVAGLLAVAAAVLVADIARGDVGGGHHTMERARRILVVATDDETAAAADRWVSEQRAEHPALQCFVLCEPEGQQLFLAIEDVIDRERPDAIVMVRRPEHADTLVGTYGRLKDELRIPVDAIYVGEGAAA